MSWAVTFSLKKRGNDTEDCKKRKSEPRSSDGIPSPIRNSTYSISTIVEATEFTSQTPDDQVVRNELHQAIHENRLEYIDWYAAMGYDLNVADGAGFTALHYASSANNVKAMLMLLENQAKVNIQDQQSLLTPLHLAVRYKNFEAMKTLIEYNADPSIKNADGATPLHYAAKHSCQAASKLLLSNTSAPVNFKDISGMTPFHLACASGSLELCEVFLENKANICRHTMEEKTPLHQAALHGNKQIVELLINKARACGILTDSYINEPDFERKTPLHLACQNGHVETARCLLNFGANILVTPQSPMHLAAANGHKPVVKLLVSHDALVECRDEFGRTPLHRAAEFDHDDVVRYLLEMKADIEAKDNAYRNAFLCAAKRGRTKTAELLLESGADFKKRDNCRRTCIHLAVQYERDDTLRMLLDRDQDKLFNKKDKDLQTPLHYAARLGHLKIVKLLLLKNCTVTRDVFERTPLHEAAEKGHVSCVEILCLTEPGHINDKDERGLTALHLAARERHSETCAVLRDMGAHTAIRDGNRWTALHYSAAAGCVRTTEILLQYHCTPHIKAEDNNGNTPLHVAAKYGHVSIVRLMLSRGADIRVRNNLGKTCFDVAVVNGKEKVAEVLIRNKKWQDILQCKDNSETNPMSNLITSMPKVAEAVMDKCIAYSDRPQSDPEYSVTFDFSLLESSDIDNSQVKGRTKRKLLFGLTTMVEAEREDLLMHPLSQALLQWKWITMGRRVFLCNIVPYLIFVILLTAFTVIERRHSFNHHFNATVSAKIHHNYIHKESAFLTAVPVMITLFISFHMLKEIYQITVQKWRYFTHFTNVFDWCCFVTTLCHVAPFLAKEPIYSEHFTFWPVATAAMLLSYINLTVFLRRISNFGIYISMFLQVSVTFLRVIFIFTPIIFSFSLGFLFLLKEQDSFSTVWWSLAKTAIMMEGEIEYGTIIVEAKNKTNEKTGALLAPHPEFSAVILVLFSMMVSLLLMNLLVGLAVGDIEKIQSNANMRRLAMQVEFLNDVDERWYRHHFLRKCFGIDRHKPELVLKPNQRKVLDFLFGVDVALCPKIDKFKDESGCCTGDFKKEEDPETMVLEEVAKQRDQIKLLQNTVKDQSRLLQEISHQIVSSSRKDTAL